MIRAAARERIRARFETGGPEVRRPDHGSSGTRSAAALLRHRTRCGVATLAASYHEGCAAGNRRLAGACGVVGARRAAGAAIESEAGEVAAHTFQGVPLARNLCMGPDPEAPEQGHGRAPALERMLEHEPRGDSGEGQPAAVAGGGEGDAGQHDGSEARLERTFEIP